MTGNVRLHAHHACVTVAFANGGSGEFGTDTLAPSMG